MGDKENSGNRGNRGKHYRNYKNIYVTLLLRTRNIRYVKLLIQRFKGIFYSSVSLELSVMWDRHEIRKRHTIKFRKCT